MDCKLRTFPTAQHFPKMRLAPLLRGDPGAHDPRGVVPHVLCMAARQLGNPVSVLVEVVSNDRALYRYKCSIHSFSAGQTIFPYRHTLFFFCLAVETLGLSEHFRFN